MARKAYTPKQKQAKDVEIRAQEATLIRREGTLKKAQEEVTRIEKLMEENRDRITKFTTQRENMGRACHLCVSAFGPDETAHKAYSADGNKRVGLRCPTCQALAAKLAPLSVTGSPEYLAKVAEETKQLELETALEAEMEKDMAPTVG